MVYRIYVEKKPGFDVEANGLKNELTSLLGIKDLTGLRLGKLTVLEPTEERSRGAVVLAVGFGGLLAGDTRRAGRGCIGLGQRRDQSGHRIIRR